MEVVCVQLGRYLFSSLAGVLCQSFTEPSDGETCSGERITFTCVAGAATTWIVRPGGVDPECVYTSVTQNPDMCGPEDMFTSSATEGSSDPRNSSLTVVLTDGLNDTIVECSETGVSDLIGLYTICIVGRGFTHAFPVVQPYQ